MNVLEFLFNITIYRPSVILGTAELLFVTL